MESDFFKDKYFNELTRQLDGLKHDIHELKNEVSEIKSKVVYMYGFAAALGLTASFIIDWLRSQFGAH